MILNLLLITCLYTLASWMMHFKKCRHILLANVFTNLLGAVYLYLNDAQVGACLCLIAASSSLFQYLLPEDMKTAREKSLRNGVALVCAVLAVYAFYSGPGDIVICSSIMFTRWAEASMSSQKVRMATAYSSLAWILYSIENTLYLMMAAEIILFLSASVAIYKARSQAVTVAMVKA